MSVERVAGGSWGDVTRDGRVVALVADGAGWVLQEVPAGRVLTRCPDRLMFVRVDCGPGKLLAATAQGHSDGAWWLWVEGRPWKTLGAVGGANCVEIVGSSWEWQVYGQLTASTYRSLPVYADGVVGGGYTELMPATSQGFADASTAGYVWRDPTLRVGEVMQPHPAGGWLVGQHKDDPPRCVLANRTGTVSRVVYAGHCEAPRAAWVDDRLVVYAMGVNEGVVARGRVEDFLAVMDPVVVPPPVVPPARPEEPMSLLGTVEEARRAYGPTMTDDECVELCNTVAWTHRAAGWGLSKKTGGTRGRRYDGQECAHDILVDAQGVEYDILTAAGAQSVPTWGKSGGFARPGREWVAPIQPKGVVVPPQPPPVTPPAPQPPPAVTCKYAPTDLTVVLAYLKEARAKAELTDARVDALRERIEAINAELHAMVVGQVQGLLEAIRSGR